MAFGNGTIWEVQSGGSDTANGGGFDPANSSMAIDLAATAGNTGSPVVTSASYNFQARDVGHWLYIKSGTNWRPGWYQIASVASNAATLAASIGAGQLMSGNVPYSLAMVAGVASIASPTGGTWSIDYTRSASAAVTFTDLVIDATTNTKFTSAANPIGVNFVGNVIAITSGTGFTVQWIQVVSVAGTAGTADKSLGTLSSTGGNGGLGGALATPGQVCSTSIAAGAGMFMKYNATAYTCSNSNNVSGGKFNLPNGPFFLVGYDTTRTIQNADTNRPTINPSVNSINPVVYCGFTSGNLITNLIVDANGKTGIHCFECDGSGSIIYRRCKAKGATDGFDSGGPATHLWDCQADTCATGFNMSSGCLLERCVATSCTSEGFLFNNGTQHAVFCLVDSCNLGFHNSSGGAKLTNCTASRSTSSGFALDTNTNGWYDSCIAYGSTSGYGFSATSGVSGLSRMVNCAVGGNSTNLESHWAAASQQIEGLITLTADPFTNKAALDFSLNDISGGGALCKGAGFPAGYAGTASRPVLDIGAVQSGRLMMSNTIFKPHPDNVSTTLASAYTAGGTSLTLASGTGAAFGTTFPMLATVAQASSYGSPAELNTIYSVTARTGDVLTIAAGGQEGTIDRNYAIGDRVEVRWTDGLAKAIEGAVNALESTVSPVGLPTALVINQGTITSNIWAINTSATWNSPGTTISHWVATITDTASSATSYLQYMQVGGVAKWALDKTGKIINGAADGALLTTGTVAAARLGTGTSSVNTWLRGDGSWQPLLKVTTYASNATIANGDTFVYCNPAAALVLTLPTISAVSGQEYVIVNGTTFGVTIQRAGTDLFLGGGTSIALAATLGKYVRLVATGAGWITTGSN